MNIMAVLGYLSYEGVGADIVDTSHVVHASDDEIVGIRGPCQVVNLGAGRTKHIFGTPCLLILEPFIAERRVMRFRGNPENDIAIISSRGENLT